MSVSLSNLNYSHNIACHSHRGSDNSTFISICQWNGSPRSSNYDSGKVTRILAWPKISRLDSSSIVIYGLTHSGAPQIITKRWHFKVCTYFCQTFIDTHKWKSPKVLTDFEQNYSKLYIVWNFTLRIHGKTFTENWACKQSFFVLILTTD